MPDPATQTRLGFAAEGGLANRVRAGLAGPLLITGARLMVLVAATGRPRVVHSLERAVGRAAERLASVRLDVAGVERVDPREQYVVVPLHEGLADVLALLRLPLGLRFAARDELFDWPGLGRYLRATRHPRVDAAPSRASARRLYGEIGRVFDEGDSLAVFAQGSILGVEVAFRPGAFHIARHFDRPLLPVVLTGSHRVWEHPYTPTLRFGERISMRVLEPVPPKILDAAGFRELERSMKRTALEHESVRARRFQPERDGWWDGYQFEIDPDFPELHARVAEHRRPEALRIDDEGRA